MPTTQTSFSKFYEKEWENIRRKTMLHDFSYLMKTNLSLLDGCQDFLRLTQKCLGTNKTIVFLFKRMPVCVFVEEHIGLKSRGKCNFWHITRSFRIRSRKAVFTVEISNSNMVIKFLRITKFKISQSRSP